MSSQNFVVLLLMLRWTKSISYLRQSFVFGEVTSWSWLKLRGFSPMQAWDIPESTGCTELESDAESSIHYQHLTFIWLSVTSIYLFFPMFFSNKKNQTNKTARLQGAWNFPCATSPSLTSNQPLTIENPPIGMPSYYRIERDAGQGFEAIANVFAP